MTLAPAEQVRRPATLPDAPFPGLRVFDIEYAPFFFGRDADRKIIVSNLEAARLTLLYGASGVGKSSVLQAGVVHTLRHRALENLEAARRRSEERDVDKPQVAKFAVAEFHSWIDDPLPQLLERTRLAAMEALSGDPLIPWEPGADVLATLREWTTRVRFLYLILDQFEEYFLYHPPSSDAGSFDVELARIVNEPGLHVHVLLSLREDALALLDRFKPTIPRLYDNYLRIDHLDLKAAEQAIRGPVAEYNELTGNEFGLDDQLVSDLLSSPELRTHRVLGSGASDMPAAEDGARPRLETPYLQLVLSRLWEAEQSANSSRLRAATLTELGGPRQIVKSHFDEAMSALTETEQETAVEIFHHLVTPSKSKIAHTVDDLADYTDLPADDIAAVLTKLCADNNNRILNRTLAPADPETPRTEEQRARYEIWHDVLAEPILAWREKKVAERHEREERKAKELAARRRMRRLVVIGACILVALGIAGLLYFNVRAVSAQHTSRSQQLAADALAQAESDPATGLGTALHALRVKSTPAAENALLTILPQSHLRAIVPSPGWVDAAALGGPRGSYVALDSSKDGQVRIWDWRTDHEVMRLPQSGYVTSAQFTNGGKLLFTASRPLTAKGTNMAVWDISRCVHDPSCKPVMSWTSSVRRTPQASISADGRWVVNDSGTDVQLWNVTACESSPSTCKAIDLRGIARVKAVAVQSIAGGAAALVTARDSEGNVVVWASTLGSEPIHLLSTPWAHPLGVAISPNGRFAAAFGDMSVMVWDLTKCRSATACSTVLNGRTPDWLQAIAFSPGSTSIVTASQDGVARVWNLSQPTAPLDLPGLKGIVFSVGFDPSGRYLVTGGDDSEARVWDVGGDSVVARAGTWITSAGYSPDGKRIAVGTFDGDLTVRSAAGGKPTTLRLPKSALAHGRDRLISAAFTRTGAVVAGISNGAAARWDLRRCRSSVCTGTSVASADTSGAFAVAPDGALLAGENRSSYEVTLVALGSDRVVATMNRNYEYGDITSFAFSPNARLLAMASATAAAAAGGTVSIWNTAACTHASKCTPELVRLLHVPSPVLSVAFSPDGSRVGAGSSDGIARVWDWRERPGPPPLELTGHTSNVGAIAFSGDGHRIATSGADTTIRIWDAQDGALLGIIRDHTDLVSAIQFDPRNSSKVLSASNDGTAIVSTCATCASVDAARAVAERLQSNVARRAHWLHSDPGRPRG